jgi:hypothetical protein
LHSRISRWLRQAATREQQSDHRWQGSRGRRGHRQKAIGSSLTMTNERQAAANRHNARKSTGPRSAAGKRRASHNSYRHGLTAAMVSNAERGRRLERLARKIAGRTADPTALQIARSAAAAEFDLAQIRRVKLALIKRILALGELERPRSFKSVRQINEFFNALDRGELKIPTPVEVAPMPSAEPERSAEAVRRALPELIKLDRYERRAAAQRERPARIITGRKQSLSNL